MKFKKLILTLFAACLVAQAAVAAAAERINFILAVTVQLNDESGLPPAIRHKAHALHRNLDI